MSESDEAVEGLDDPAGRPRRTVEGLTKTLPDRYVEQLSDSGPAPRESQLRVLVALWESRPQPATRSWLAGQVDMAESTVGRAVEGLEDDDLAADRTLRGQSQTQPISLVDPKYGPSEFSDRSSMMPAIIEAGPLHVLNDARARDSLKEATWFYAILFALLGTAARTWHQLGGVAFDASGNVFYITMAMMVLCGFIIPTVTWLTRKIDSLVN